MRLLEEVKRLRTEFPDIKIRQLLDKYNRKYALFVLPDCAEELRLIFEYDYMILDFYGSQSYFAYSDNEFRYMIEEIRSLIECRSLVISVECNGENCGSRIVNTDELNDIFLKYAAINFCRMNRIKNPKNIFIYKYFCNTWLDSTDFFKDLNPEYSKA